MKKFTLKSLLAGTICACGLFLLASCSESPEFESALPDTKTRAEIKPDSIWFEFYNLPDPIYPSQRITFRIFNNGGCMYNQDKLNIRVIDPETRKTLPITYDAANYLYHFFTGSAKHYLLEVSLIGNPEVAASWIFHVTPGVFLKLVPEDRWEYTVPEKDGTVFLQANTVYFYTDDTCTTRVMSLPYPIVVRVHLVKKAIELFSPNVSNLYRDEDVHTAQGASESCSGRLIVTQQTLPSGEYLEDYYEIEVLKVFL